MFRKLSVAALLVLASGAQAQKKVTSADFCAVPTPEGTRLSIVGGTLLVDGFPFPDPGVALPAISSIDNGPVFFNPVGNYMSPLRPGVCPATGAARAGTWQAACNTDFYEPVVQRLTNAAANAAGNSPTAAQLQAACEGAAVPTAAQTGASTAANPALCSSEISVTENTANKGVSKLGSSLWYNYSPVVTYNLIGGYQNQDFDTLLPANTDTERYCIYWPSFAAVAGKSGGGTNKLAKPIVSSVTTTLAFTNAPAGAARYADLAAFVGLAAGATLAPLVPPSFQETVSVRYHKNGPPSSGL